MVSEVLTKIEDKLTGRTSRLREIYRAAFSETETERLVQSTKKQNRQIAVVALLLIAIVLLAAAPGDEGAAAGLDLARPGAADPPAGPTDPAPPPAGWPNR